MTPTAPAGLMTAEEFYEWANQPAFADRRWELDDGVPVEVGGPDVPSPGEMHGLVCGWVAFLLWQYVARRGGGRVLSNDTGLVVRRRPDAVRGPDVMYLPESRRVADSNRGHVTDVPALVVEVYSPTDRPGRLNRRVAQYLNRGVPLVWVVYPEDQTVDVYRPGAAPDSREGADELAFPDVLPDFRHKVADLFALPGTAPPAGTI